MIDKGDIEHKISLFADDIFLYITNPSTSIPFLVKCYTLWRYLRLQGKGREIGSNNDFRTLANSLKEI